jgi:hypothetical protein
MPQIANVTVKKNDGTTDVIYTAVVPSAGDKSPALFRNTTVGSAAAHQPSVTVTSRSNGPGTARRVEIEGRYPTLVTGGDGKISVSDRVIISLSAVVPMGMPTVEVNEAVSQLLNFTASTLMKDTVKTGFAPS